MGDNRIQDIRRVDRRFSRRSGALDDDSLAKAGLLMRKSPITIKAEAPDSRIAAWCFDQYYRELAARFEGGFDPGAKAYAGSGKTAAANSYLVIAWMNAAPVGCGALLWSDKSVGEIKRMWVAPEARGLGVARRILEHLENAARRAGLAAVRLDTNRVLLEAQKLYRSAGFAEIERYSENPYAHHWFEKRLMPD